MLKILALILITYGMLNLLPRWHYAYHAGESRKVKIRSIVLVWDVMLLVLLYYYW